MRTQRPRLARRARPHRRASPTRTAISDGAWAIPGLRATLGS